MTSYTFTIKRSGDRFYIFRDGEKLGAKYGYATEADARLAIWQTRRWDRIAK